MSLPPSALKIELEPHESSSDEAAIDAAATAVRRAKEELGSTVIMIRLACALLVVWQLLRQYGWLKDIGPEYAFTMFASSAVWLLASAVRRLQLYQGALGEFYRRLLGRGYRGQVEAG